MITADVFRIVNIDLEGGARVSDDALDAGGVTKWGFAQRYNPDVDVRALTESDARGLAYNRYWLPMHCDQYSAGVQLAVYDAAFNHGVARATAMLQFAAGVRLDGAIGALTIRAVRALDVGTFLIRLNERRIAAYLERNDAAEERFERGWLNRVLRITVESMRLEARKTGA